MLFVKTRKSTRPDGRTNCGHDSPITTVLDHPDATVRINEIGGGKRTIIVEPKGSHFVSVRTCETAYPMDLTEHVLQVKGPAYLCDEIMRDEGPLYVQHHFRWDILSYVEESAFDGRSVLDFGSGSGASTMVLARMLPASTRIVGVELVPPYVELARHRASFYRVDHRVTFQVSATPNSLPAGMGQFDYCVFSAVYEHLLPAERPVVLPLIWSHLKPGGILFLDQTPYRWFPIETHTTDLPLINYLPDQLALAFARRCSKRVRPDESWAALLRGGIRGATTREIMGILNRHPRQAMLLEPSRFGLKDRIDLWYSLSSTTRNPLAKKVMMWGFRAVRATTGVTMIPTLSLAIQKIR
jgi:SAM-dependent methyltransferase